MFISDVSIRRPVFTTMMTLCLIVLGVMGLKRLGTDLFPEVTIPNVVVHTIYPGAGPAEIESQVVKPIEDAVSGISGVQHIQSWSRDNMGLLWVRFSMSKDYDAAVQDVRDKVGSVVDKLPRDAQAPVITPVDIGAFPVLTYAVSAELSSQELRKLLEDRVRPALAQVDGAAEIRITGGDVREIQVDIDLDKARAAGVSPFEIAQRIGAENLNLPLGRLQLGPTELAVRSVSQFRSLEELRALPVARSHTGAQVRLEEIATVRDGVAERRTTARLNGNDAVVLEVVKQPGSNTVKVADLAKKRLEELAPTLGHGFKASLIIDQSEDIRANAHEVWIALIFGGAMAVLIILLFLLDVRGTIISALALPTSVVGTFFVMDFLGYTLNQMTLLSLALAIGLLIDDAVVVREAITHRLEKGEEPMSAASKGTKDVGLAVLATTLSLVSVFIPVAFMGGMVGQFFKQFGVTISVAVLLSLFISFTLDPMLSSRFAKVRKPGQAQRERAVARALRGFHEGTERLYERILRWVLDHKWATAGLTLLVLVGSFGAASRLGSEFISGEDRAVFLVNLTLPDSASLAETEARTAEAEALLLRIPEIRDIYSIVGHNGEVNKARLRVKAVPKQERARGLVELREEARGLLTTLVSTQVVLTSPLAIEQLGGDWFPVMARLTGPDFERLGQEAQRLEQIIKDIPGTSDVRIETIPPKPEMQIQIDRVRAADSGLSAAALAMQLRLAIDGDVAARLREGTDETDIRVRLAEQDRSTPERVRQLEVLTPQGLRPVTDVAQVELRDGPAVIQHFDRQRQIAIFAGLAPGTPLGDVAKEVRARVAAANLPAGYSVTFDGEMRDLDEQAAAFSAAFGLAFIFIYMVLASQFESFKHPFTIMVSLPLALVGALLGLVVTGNHLSLGAMIGVILLMGLVTKNAILLVDGALQNLRAGCSVDEALMKAGPRRLRPILMTSAAMAIGMVPTAVGRGLGSEFRAPMAIAVIGGVITSTFLTLLVVPVVFAAMERLSRIFQRKKPESQPEVTELTAAVNSTEDRAA
jgi:hydrophobic/amphiphilic exporter-1 (mainly G- bacteria), HAE1 family